MTEILVDTNVLVYSVLKTDEKKHFVSGELVSKLIDKKEFAASIQNLAELSRVLSEKAAPPVSHEDIQTRILGFMKFGRIVSYSENTVIRALSVSKEYKIHFFDALIAATMQESGISTIYTENTSDFSKIPMITAKNPFSER